MDYLNTFFSGVGEVLSNKIGVPERKLFEEPVTAHSDKIVVCKEFVDILLGDININKTSGIEGIRCDILKFSLRFLLEQVTWLYQLSFDTGIFPATWKLARVNPIPKTGNSKLITNWRPISLLPVPSKKAERIMHIHLGEVLKRDKILSDKTKWLQIRKRHR